MELNCPTALTAAEIDAAVSLALREDVGTGDVTVAAVVDPGSRMSARLVFREDAIVCGLAIAEAVFRQLDREVVFTVVIPDGKRVKPGAVVAQVDGPTSAILTGERVALNFLARMSAIATLTRQHVDAVAGTRARILDTRKTTPGLRALEKYAVRIGGGSNHRMGLYDAILIKDNHIRHAGSVSEAIGRAQKKAGSGMRIEVEVESVEDVREALLCRAHMLLLDNMSPELMRQVVVLAAGSVPLEASGGITLDTVRSVAETGVDFISIGALTHSAGSIDVSLEVP